MYKASFRLLTRLAIKQLNEGDAGLLLRLASPKAELCFSGRNSWGRMFREPVRGRQSFATHRGIDEIAAFTDRFIAEGLQLEIEDILVNGPPWRTRVALRAVLWIPDPGGGPDPYNNRLIALQEVRWGRIHRWEDYEDSERTADWDAGLPM